MWKLGLVFAMPQDGLWLPERKIILLVFMVVPIAWDRELLLELLELTKRLEMRFVGTVITVRPS